MSILERWPCVAALIDAGLNSMYPHEQMQDPKRQTRYTYSEGPMIYLGQQIRKQMQDAGFPAKQVFGFRTAKEQMELYAQGRQKPGKRVTNAPAWQSAHNYWEAVDMVHPSKGWEVSMEYWDTYAACIEIVESKFRVKLRHGHDWDGDGIPVPLDPDERLWDAAHTEMADWREWKNVIDIVAEETGRREKAPSQFERWYRFCYVLPKIARKAAYQRVSPGAYIHAVEMKGRTVQAKADALMLARKQWQPTVN